MKPLPAQQVTDGRPPGEVIPSLPGPLASQPGNYSTANRRATTCGAQRAYPWLLSATTATAALFCIMYITKPVIVSESPAPRPSGDSVKPALAMAGTSSTPASLMPGGNRLPGEQGAPATEVKPSPADPRSTQLPPPSTNAFEETNLRIQHILTAEAPGGHLDRIDIDVPVLYHSRNLSWTSTEVAEARLLLVRLMDYEEKSRHLRSEGSELLDAWNRLIGKSIPAAQLRADSPSLPENQLDAADAPRPAGLITDESIQLQPSGK